MAAPRHSAWFLALRAAGAILVATAAQLAPPPGRSGADPVIPLEPAIAPLADPTSPPPDQQANPGPVSPAKPVSPRPRFPTDPTLWGEPSLPRITDVADLARLNADSFGALLEPLQHRRPSQPTVRVMPQPATPGRPPGAAPAPQAATYAFTRTEFGVWDEVYPDGAASVVAPHGDYVYVARKLLVKNLPSQPGKAFSFLLVEAYTKDGQYRTFGAMPLQYALDFVGGIDAYVDANGNTALFVVGSFNYKPMVAKFYHNKALNTLSLVAASGAPSQGTFAILMDVKVWTVNGAPSVYVLGSDWTIPPGNPDGLTDGIISRFDLNLRHIASTRIWTAAQGFPCKDEIEINSLYIDRHGIFTVADVDKQSDHFIGSCNGKPPRGGVSRTSLDLQTSTFKKFDDSPGSDFRSSDSISGDGNGTLFITGVHMIDGIPGALAVVIVQWTGSGFSEFTYLTAGHPGQYAAHFGMTIGGTLYRKVDAARADLLVAGYVQDATENCMGDTCADWETWIGDPNTLGLGGGEFAADILAFTESFVSPTYDVPHDIAADADDPNVYYQVGCSNGTKYNNGFSTDCYTIYPDSPNVNARAFKITVTAR